MRKVKATAQWVIENYFFNIIGTLTKDSYAFTMEDIEKKVRTYGKENYNVDHFSSTYGREFRKWKSKTGYLQNKGYKITELKSKPYGLWRLEKC